MIRAKGKNEAGEKKNVKATPTKLGLLVSESFVIPYFKNRFSGGPRLSYEMYNFGIEDESLLYRNAKYSALKFGVMLNYLIPRFRSDATLYIDYPLIFSYAETPDIPNYEVKSSSHYVIGVEWRKYLVRHLDIMFDLKRSMTSVTYENGEAATDSTYSLGIGVRYWF
jgi:hypothetical protein